MKERGMLMSGPTEAQKAAIFGANALFIGVGQLEICGRKCRGCGLVFNDTHCGHNVTEKSWFCSRDCYVPQHALERIKDEAIAAAERGE